MSGILTTSGRPPPSASLRRPDPSRCTAAHRNYVRCCQARLAVCLNGHIVLSSPMLCCDSESRHNNPSMNSITFSAVTAMPVVCILPCDVCHFLYVQLLSWLRRKTETTCDLRNETIYPVSLLQSVQQRFSAISSGTLHAVLFRLYYRGYRYGARRFDVV